VSTGFHLFTGFAPVFANSQTKTGVDPWEGAVGRKFIEKIED
jgi:hypothetical protein